MTETIFQPKLRPSSNLGMWERLVFAASPSTAKRTGTFPDLSMASVFGWSGAGWAEDVAEEDGGQSDDLRAKNTKKRSPFPFYEKHHIGRADLFSRT